MSSVLGKKFIVLIKPRKMSFIDVFNKYKYINVYIHFRFSL